MIGQHAFDTRLFGQCHQGVAPVFDEVLLGFYDADEPSDRLHLGLDGLIPELWCGSEHRLDALEDPGGSFGLVGTGESPPNHLLWR